jgi:predicted transcriptional regulator
MSLNEYKKMVVLDILQKKRIKQIKSTKLIMPTSNINMAAGHSGNLNKLFNFSKR